MEVLDVSKYARRPIPDIVRQLAMNITAVMAYSVAITVDTILLILCSLI